MQDNTAAGPSKDQRGERDDVTRTPGTGGASRTGGGGDTVRESVIGREGSGTRTGAAAAAAATGTPAGVGERETSPRAPEGIGARAGSGTRDDLLGGRDTAGQDGVRGGRDSAARESVPARPDSVERDGSPAHEGGISGPAGAGAHEDGHGGRNHASRDGVVGAGTRTSGGSAENVGGRLMPHDEGDKWSLRLQHAVTAFVDGPRGSVEEADQVLQEVAERFADAVTQRRRTLRTSWQTTGDDKADTEQLRLALRDYRELAERLLKM
ncbi:hypothetical protein ACFWBR_07715 [Streptomyces sp. NPDC060006]|uniref:hypothetical protein n=1 Tax=unclassified Streptomyces TaxID=2593676 RepID=UPI0036C403D0